MHYSITNHSHVNILTITNNCVNINVPGKNENKSVPKSLLQISVRNLHNDMVRPVSQGGLSEARDRNNNIVISDYVLCYILPPNLRNISLCKKSMYGYNVFTYTNSIHAYLITWQKKH